jgi:hypothetical protein
MPVVEEGRFRGAIYGVSAAALFGASAPLAKLLLPGATPLSLSSPHVGRRAHPRGPARRGTLPSDRGSASGTDWSSSA